MSIGLGILGTYGYAHFNSYKSRELTEEITEKISNGGLYHVTLNENISKIMTDNIADIHGTKGFGAYSRMGKNTVFFFSEPPSMEDLKMNIPFKGNDMNLSEYSVIHISPDETKKIIDRLTYRVSDNAIMCDGDLKINAKVIELENLVEKEENIKKNRVFDEINRFVNTSYSMLKGTYYDEIYKGFQNQIELLNINKKQNIQPEKIDNEYYEELIKDQSLNLKQIKEKENNKILEKIESLKDNNNEKNINYEREI